MIFLNKRRKKKSLHILIQELSSLSLCQYSCKQVRIKQACNLLHFLLNRTSFNSSQTAALFLSPDQVSNWKMCLVIIALNTVATFLASNLITNSVLLLRGLSTWSSWLSLWLHNKAKQKPGGMPCHNICVQRTVAGWARTGPINISLSSYLIETSSVLNHQTQRGFCVL